MDTYRRIKVRRLRELVERGAYGVDPNAVADAIVQFLSGADLALEYAQSVRQGDAQSLPMAGVTGAVDAGHAGTRLAA